MNGSPRVPRSHRSLDIDRTCNHFPSGFPKVHSFLFSPPSDVMFRLPQSLPTSFPSPTSTGSSTCLLPQTQARQWAPVSQLNPTLTDSDGPDEFQTWAPGVRDLHSEKWDSTPNHVSSCKRPFLMSPNVGVLQMVCVL